MLEPDAMHAAQEVIRAAEARGWALADGDARRLASLLHQGFRWTSYLGEPRSVAICLLGLRDGFADLKGWDDEIRSMTATLDAEPEGTT